mmetsp:Transcript_6669/g.13988  ORF Transcript_6669/g.13988 Transcript_6669/m.13988 type:complete len:86 (+) Transcript_6669:333-590(+)
MYLRTEKYHLNDPIYMNLFQERSLLWFAGTLAYSSPNLEALDMKEIVLVVQRVQAALHLLQMPAVLLKGSSYKKMVIVFPFQGEP